MMDHSGPTGNGIATIVKTSTSGLVDTYTITFTNGTTTTFDITNGQDGEVTEEELDEVKELNQRLLNNTPSGTTNTNPAYITDSADLPLNKFVLGGKTEQDSTTGKNIAKEEFDQKLRIVASGSDRIIEATTYNDAQIVPCKPSTTYVIDGDFSVFADGNCRVRAFDNYPTLGIIDTNTAFSNGSSRFTITTDATSNYLFIYNTGDNKNINVPNMFVCKQQYADTYEPYTGGIPSPNPTYPQEIRNVEGKNKFDKSNSSIINQSISGTSRYGYKLPKANKDFYISKELDLNAFKIYEDIYGTLTDKGTITTTPLLITNSNNDFYILCVSTSSQTSATEMLNVNNFMIAYDNSPYVPYNCIQIKKCNKNWFNQTEFEAKLVTGKIKNDSGVEVNDAGSTYSTYTIPFKANEPLHLYGWFQRIYFYDNNMNWVERTNPQSNSARNETILKSYNGYMQFQIYNSPYAENKGQEQIEEGSTHTSYVTHAGKTYYFPLSEGQKLMQDGKIEDKVVNEWGEVVFDGTEAYWRYSSTYHEITMDNVLPQGSSSSMIINGYCNYCDTTTTTNIEYINSTKKALGFKNLISFWGLEEESVEAWKALLVQMKQQGKPLTIQYPLATPDETAFTPEQQSVIDEIIKDGTYKEVTHYTAEASINPDMEIGYYKDLEILFNNLS